MQKKIHEAPSTENRTEPCPFCEGTGQTGHFGGVSRFVISWEDCPDCCGTGVIEKTPPSLSKTTEEQGKSLHHRHNISSSDNKEK